MSLGRQQLFVKDVAPNDVVPQNHWGVYQAVRWAVGAAFQSACRSGFGEAAGQGWRWAPGREQCLGRWLQWKTALMNLGSPADSQSVALEKPLGQKPACRLGPLPVPQK